MVVCSLSDTMVGNYICGKSSIDAPGSFHKYMA